MRATGVRLLLGAFLISAAGCRPPATETDPVSMAESEGWSAVVDAARGQTVHMMMWMGDPLINEYMRTYVTPAVDSLYGVALQFIPAQGSDIVSRIVTELEAGSRRSGADVVWINGESFYQLR